MHYPELSITSSKTVDFQSKVRVFASNEEENLNDIPDEDNNENQDENDYDDQPMTPEYNDFVTLCKTKSIIDYSKIQITAGTIDDKEVMRF